MITINNMVDFIGGHSKVMSAKIIAFPEHRIVQTVPAIQPPNEQELKNNIDSLKKAHINDTLLFIFPIVIDQLIQAGFKLPNENCDKNAVFLFEAFNALLLKYYDLKHPFHSFTEEEFVMNEENGAIYMQSNDNEIEEKEELDS